MMGFTGRAQQPSLHPGFIAGNWYQPIAGASVAAGTAPPANTIALVPFVLTRPIIVQALGARVTSASAGGNFQLAIYAHNPATGRPTGDAIVSIGNISTAAVGAVSAPVAAQATLAPGLYWMAMNQDNSVAAFQTLATVVPQATALVGSAMLANIASTGAAALLHLTVAQAFGAWPNLSGAAFTEITAAPRYALAYLQAG